MSADGRHMIVGTGYPPKCFGASARKMVLAAETMCTPPAPVVWVEDDNLGMGFTAAEAAERLEAYPRHGEVSYEIRPLVEERRAADHAPEGFEEFHEAYMNGAKDEGKAEDVTSESPREKTGKTGRKRKTEIKEDREMKEIMSLPALPAVPENAVRGARGVADLLGISYVQVTKTMGAYAPALVGRVKVGAHWWQVYDRAKVLEIRGAAGTPNERRAEKRRALKERLSDLGIVGMAAAAELLGVSYPTFWRLSARMRPALVGGTDKYPVYDPQRLEELWKEIYVGPRRRAKARPERAEKASEPAPAEVTPAAQMAESGPDVEREERRPESRLLHTVKVTIRADLVEPMDAGEIIAAVVGAYMKYKETDRYAAALWLEIGAEHEAVK